MDEEIRPLIDCSCPCGKYFKINSKFLLPQIEIRKEDLEPVLEQVGILLSFPVFFIPHTIFTETRKQNNALCLLDFYFSFTWFYLDSDQHINITSSECAKKSDAHSSPCYSFTKIIDSLIKPHHQSGEDKFNRIEESDTYAVSYPVELADTVIGVLGLGPFNNHLEPFRPNWDKIKIRIEKALKHSAKNLQNVLWRRAEDCLTEQSFAFLKEIAKPYHKNDFDSQEEVENVTKELIEGLTALTRQCFIMDGSMVFLWNPQKSSFYLFTESGPGCTDQSWKEHKMLLETPSPSLVSKANEVKNIVIWQYKESNSTPIHNEARHAYDEEHKKHPLRLCFAIPMLMEGPALGLTIVCYNPVGLDGKEISDEKNLERFKNDYEEYILKELPTPNDRNRFELLVRNELKRLLSTVYRERRGWYFRKLVKQGSTVTSYEYLKSEFENMITNQANALSVKVNKVTSNENDPSLEIDKPVIRPSQTNGRGEWFLRTPLSSATGKAQYHCDITWDNLLEKSAEVIKDNKDRMMSLLAHGGTLLSARERMDSWKKSIENFYESLKQTKVAMKWSEVLAFAKIIGENINCLSGSPKQCTFYEIEDWWNHLWDETGRAVKIKPAHRFLKIFPAQENQSKAEYLDKKSTEYILRSGLEIARTGWQDISNIPKMDANKALFIIVLGQPRGLLLIDAIEGVFEENSYLIELFAHLLSRSLYLLRLRSEIEHAQFIRNQLQKNQNALPANIVENFLSLLKEERDIWPGFIWAQGILRVPWSEEPLLTVEYSPPHHSVKSLEEVKYVSEEWLEKLQIAGAVEEYRKDDKRYRVVKIYKLPPDDIKELPLDNSLETPIIIIPLFSIGANRGWIIGKLPHDVTFAVIRLAESMAHEASQFLHQSQKETEEMFSRSLFVHGIRNNAHNMSFMLKRLFRVRDEVKDMFERRLPNWGKDLDMLDDVEQIMSDLIRKVKLQDYFTELIQSKSSIEFPQKVFPSCNLVDIVYNQAKILRKCSEKAKKVEIKIINDSNSKYIPIQGDERQIKIIVENLMDNAVKYSFCNNRIYVIIEYTVNEQRKSCWSLEVISKGKPFPPNVKALRQPGAREYRDPKRKNIPGRGLGLTLIHMICDQIAADLHLWSEFMKTANDDKNSATSWCLNHVKINFLKAGQGDKYE